MSQYLEAEALPQAFGTGTMFRACGGSGSPSQLTRAVFPIRRDGPAAVSMPLRRRGIAYTDARASCTVFIRIDCSCIGSMTTVSGPYCGRFLGDTVDDVDAVA